MKKLAPILLIFSLLGLGTGALQHVHEMMHAAEDAQEAALAKKAGLPEKTHHHDEDNCDVCAQLHMALILHGWVSVVICLGLFVAFLTPLLTPLIGRAMPVRIDCRGPPALHSCFSI